MENPTPEGASIQDRLMAYLDPPEAKEVDQEPQETPEEEPSEEPTQAAEPEEEPSESEPEPDGEEDQEALSLSDIAEILDIDESNLDIDEDGKVVLKTKIDGQEGKVRLKDAHTSYQIRGHLDNKTREATQLQEELKAKQAALEQVQSEKLQQAEEVIQVAFQELTNEFQSIDWNELKALDPAEWSVKRAEFQDRQSRLQDAFQKTQVQRAEQFQKQQQSVKELLAIENQKLVSAIEEWKNTDVAKKEYKETMSYLTDQYGFNDEDLYGKWDTQGNLLQPGITDHRLVVIFRKAMLFDKLQTSKPEVTKKVRVAPKMVKPGQPKTKEETQTKSLEKLKQKVKQGGSAAEWLLAAGKV